MGQNWSAIKSSLRDTHIIKSSSVLPTQNTEACYLKVVQRPAHVQFQLQQKIALESHHYYKGCCTLPSGLLVFIDNIYNDGKVLIIKSDGSLRSIIKFEWNEGACDVTPVNDHHVAVSNHYSGTISIIDVDSDQVVRKLEVGMYVTGLCCKGRDIVSCVGRKGLVIVNIDSEEVEMVVKDKSVDWESHVKVSNILICYTYPISSTVIVLDNHYNVIFKYKDRTVLGHPIGVTIDDHSNIYVIGYWSHNLVMISSDGKSCHQLLGKDDGLDGPAAVHYDSSTKKLVVVNRKGPAFIYTVA